MRKGFTLIETMIYIGIISTIFFSFVMFALSIGNSKAKTIAVQEVQSNGRLALEVLTNRIMSANAVNIGTSTFGSDPGVLSLGMDDTAKNPTIINLTVNDGFLQITEGLSAPVALTTDKVKVTNLVFTNLTGAAARKNIRIQMTISYVNPSGDVNYNYTENFQTAVSLRQ